MRKLPLGNNRFIEVPDKVPVCNRFVVGTDDNGISLAFIVDDGKSARLVAAVSLEKERVAAFARAIVEATESLGEDWKSIRPDPLPQKPDSAH
jgi:hypothetical protein